MPQNVLTSDSWQFIAKSHRNLLDRIRAAGKPLGEVVKGHFHNGVKSGLTDAFIVDIETRDKLITEHESSSEQREAISVLARYIIFLSHLKIVQQTIAS